MDESAMEQSPVKRIPRMRTARKIVGEIKKLDPDSDVTEYCVRQIIKSGAVPVTWAGGKALVNLDAILEVFNMGTEQPSEPEEPVVGGIRRVSVTQ